VSPVVTVIRLVTACVTCCDSNKLVAVTCFDSNKVSYCHLL